LAFVIKLTDEVWRFDTEGCITIDSCNFHMNKIPYILNVSGFAEASCLLYVWAADWHVNSKVLEYIPGMWLRYLEQ